MAFYSFCPVTYLKVPMVNFDNYELIYPDKSTIDYLYKQD